MARAHRASMTAVVIVGLLSTHWNGALFASEAERSSSIVVSEEAVERALSEVLGTAPPRAKQAFDATPGRRDQFAGQIYQGQPYPYPYRHRRDGSIAAIMIGAAAAITGAAVLVYANRPECTTDALAGGCGYGTRVVGTAVLSGGIVGLFVGALTWR